MRLHSDLLRQIRENDPSLTQVSCRVNKAKHATALVDALQGNTHLKSMTLSVSQRHTDRETTDDVVISLIDALKNIPPHTAPISLDFGFTDIATATARALVPLIESNIAAITSVNLGYNLISDDCIIALLRAVASNTSLRSFQFSIGDKEEDKPADKLALIHTLIDTLRVNKTLHSLSLNLTSTNISIDCANVLADLLRLNASALTSLKLVNITIDTEEAMSILVDALKDNKTLTLLDLSASRVKTKAMIILARALEDNKTLTSLELDEVHIKPDAIQALVDAIRTNTTLISIAQDNYKFCDSRLSRHEKNLIVSFVVRNQIIAQLATTAESGDTSAISDLLDKLEETCPDIDSPDSIQPAKVIKLYQDYKYLIEAMTQLSTAAENDDAIATVNTLMQMKTKYPDIDQPSSTQLPCLTKLFRDSLFLSPNMLSPSIVIALLDTTYPASIQTFINKTLATYLLANAPLTSSDDEISLSLPDDIDENRFRMIVWLLRDCLNDPDVQWMVSICAQAIQGTTYASAPPSFAHMPNAFDLNQLLNIAADQDVDKALEADRKIVLNHLRLLQRTAPSVSAAAAASSSGHSFFDARTAASPAPTAESDKAQHKDPANKTKKPK